MWQYDNWRQSLKHVKSIFPWSLSSIQWVKGWHALEPNHHWQWHQLGKTPGPQFDIKMSSYQYRKSHCGDKTVVRSSYLHNGISYTGKITSLYWIRAQHASQLVADETVVEQAPLSLVIRQILTSCMFTSTKHLKAFLGIAAKPPDYVSMMHCPRFRSKQASTQLPSAQVCCCWCCCRAMAQPMKWPLTKCVQQVPGT